MHLLRTVTKRDSRCCCPAVTEYYKAPAATETESRFAFLVATHTGAAPPTLLWAGLPPRGRRLTSHRAQLPLHHTPAALRTRCAPHTIRIPPYLHLRSSNAPSCTIASSSSVRQHDRSMQGPRFAMLVHLAMTLSAVDGWGLPWDNKTSSLSSNESAITGGADDARDRRQLDWSHWSSCNADCDGSCDGCSSSCDGYWSWGTKYGCNDSCDTSCNESCSWWSGCDSGCDGTCDGSCTQGCDSGCTSSCDSSCNLACDDSCDESCFTSSTGFQHSCDAGCDAGCDRPC